MASQEHKFTNHLIHETSPYLLQHAHNPVDWFPWGKEALGKAGKENKLIIVSIGYAACHWCHVMGHESFEDERVAEFMNSNFVAVKVDREERPDIDQVYMNAVQLIAGSGGWPLNCIALPDGRPVYGGTYFSKIEWIDMLSQVLNFVKQNAEKAEQQAMSLTQGIRSGERIFINPEKAEFKIDDLKNIFYAWKNNIDYINGGYRGAPKFPMPSGFCFLLHYHHLTGNADALKAVTTTLNKMAEGGIYDQVGGGFARYSTDELWKVPHFEKMLYDNAQLVSLYSAAYQKTKYPEYGVIVEETLDFIQREMTSEEGGFYSSLDADSEGEEGKYYTWTYPELQKALGDKAGLIFDYYNVSESGNWENGRNILFKRAGNKEAAEKYNILESELAKLLSEAKCVLLQERDKRIRPGADDKIITSWNALMLKAYTDAYRVFYDKEYLDIALKNAEFLNTKVKSPDGRLNRNYKNGASINAFLDDYAFTIEAFISLYQATFEEKWLKTARQLSDYTLLHFYNKDNGMFYYTSDIDPELISRNTEVTDNVVPSSNSVMAKNLYVLGQYFYNDDYTEKSRIMLNNVKKNVFKYGAYFANWDILMAWFAGRHYDLSITGRDFEAVRRELDKHYLPDVFFSGGITEGTLPLLENKLIEGKTMIYLCRDRVCKSPATEVREVLKEIKTQVG